jgi:hypothetical protein
MEHTEHDPEKWLPVFGKDHAPAKYPSKMKKEPPLPAAQS